MTTDNAIGFIAVAGIAIMLYASHAYEPPPSTAGLAPIQETAAQITAWSAPSDATDRIDALDAVTGQPLARFVRGRDNVLRLAAVQPALPAGAHGVRLVDTPIIAIGEQYGSLGAFAGVFSGDLHNGHRAQAGLHYEPFAFFADTLHAPSVALSTDLIGLGITANLPPSHFPSLGKLGVGCWEAAPFDGSHPALLYGTEFHCTFP
jgi:hypothetical protein